MSDYFKEREYYIEKIWFRYEGIEYHGNGVLRWRPERGCHLVAQMHGDTILQRKELRSIDFKKNLRMRMEINSLGNNITVITPYLRINEWSLLFKEPFISNFRHILFIDNLPNSQITKKNWHGSAMYEAEGNLLFPDRIEKETRIGDIETQSFDSSGFNYNGNKGEQIIGEIKDQKYLYFDWSLPKEHWTKNQSWRFAAGLQDAISIISGKVVRSCLKS